MRQRSWLPYLILLLGVLIASSAAILIRLAQEQSMPSLVIATGRLGVAALILSPIAWTRAGSELRNLRRKDIVLGVASGLFLALHLATWISSLEYTSVASSAALVTTNPLWVGLASWFILRERPTWSLVLGILLTMTGSCLIAFSDSSNAYYPQAVLGDLLALTGALTVTGYFLIGRSLRGRISLLAYIWMAYTSAALTLLIVVLVTGQSLAGYPAIAYIFVLGLALGPQLLGHTSLNWALRFMSATFVAVALLAEPIGSALLALAIFPDEHFAPLQLAGFMLLLVGIYIAARYERRAFVANRSTALDQRPLSEQQPATQIK